MKEGKVEVSTGVGNKRVSLAPGEAWTSAEGAAGEVQSIASSESEFSWIDGTLFFESTPLEEVIASINRYSEVKVLLEN